MSSGSAAGSGGAGSSKQTTAPAEGGKKRARYTSIACNECKRRKIKCNGEKPCERCGNQGLDCVYATNDFTDSDEYRRMAGRIEALESQVRELYGLVSQLRHELITLKGGPSAGTLSIPMANIAQNIAQTDMHQPQDPSVFSDFRLMMAATGGGQGDVSGLGSVGGAAGGEGHAHGRGQGGAEGMGDLAMDVDMSRGGHSPFLGQQQQQQQDAGHALAGHPDPLLSIERRDAIRLLSLYSTQIHPIYPFINMSDILWHMNKIMDFREASSRSGLHSLFPDRFQIMTDPLATTIKMIYAIAATAENLGPSAQAHLMYANVQQIYKEHGYPPAEPEPEPDETEEAVASKHRAWIENSIRLRLYQGLWHLQHGEEEQALIEVSEARRTYEQELKALEEEDISRQTQDQVPLSEVLYSTYWMFVVLLKRPPRFDFGIEGTPWLDFPDDFPQDEEGTLRGPLREYAKVASMMCFAFETSEHTSSALLATVMPPFTKAGAFDHVNRWQTHFGDGLRSMSTKLPGNLSGKSPKERVVQSIVYLMANYLRLLISRYKSPAPYAIGSPSDPGSTSASGSMTTTVGMDGDSEQVIEQYEGALAELYASAKHAQDNLQVLWNVHQTATTWRIHSALYNRFLVQAADWLYGLLAARTVALTLDVRTSLERALVMLETYAACWSKTGFVLQKLRESRDHGVLGGPLM